MMVQPWNPNPKNGILRSEFAAKGAMNVHGIKYSVAYNRYDKTIIGCSWVCRECLTHSYEKSNHDPKCKYFTSPYVAKKPDDEAMIQVIGPDTEPRYICHSKEIDAETVRQAARAVMEKIEAEALKDNPKCIIYLPCT